MKIIVYIVSIGCMLIVRGCLQPVPEPFVAVNQAGYKPYDIKQAFLVNSEASRFVVVDAELNNVVFSGSIEETLQPDLATGDMISVIDFSGFASEGNFLIRAEGSSILESEPFPIHEKVYMDVTRKALQSYYYNRCGTEVGNGKPWKHAVCHLDDAVFYDHPSIRKDVTGGWHDAGDYGKFSINTALSAGLLLYLYELDPDAFTDRMLIIPESGNGIPDLLDEVRWALDWLLKMQNASNGGIYHKVSQKKWVGEFLPHEDPETRYIFQISSNATAGFAAVAALGAQLYLPYDPLFSQQLSQAAFAAWDYLEEHPVTQPLGGFKNPPDVHGGEYGDPNDRDERLWAAIELYKLTGEEDFLNYFVNHARLLNIANLPPLSWRDFHSLAISVFLDASLPDNYIRYQERFLSQLQTYADHILWRSRNNNYQTLLRHTEYYWGSNSVNLGYAFVFIQLYRHTQSEKYFQAALNQLHYTLGRNPFNQTFVTGIGAAPVRFPYYQFSMEAKHENPVPGMMAGGPNNVVHLRGRVLSPWPGKNYEDDEKNFYVNEVAINFTAIFAYISGFFSVQQSSKNNNLELEIAGKE